MAPSNLPNLPYEIWMLIFDNLDFRGIVNFAFTSRTTWSVTSRRLYELGARQPYALMHTAQNGHVGAMRSLIAAGADVTSRFRARIPEDELWQKVIGLYHFGIFPPPSASASDPNMDPGRQAMISDHMTEFQRHPRVDDEVLSQFPQSVLSPTVAFSLPGLQIGVPQSPPQSTSLVLTNISSLYTQAQTISNMDKKVTALHVAAMNGHLEAVRTLIAHGADIIAQCTGLCACSTLRSWNGYESGGIHALPSWKSRHRKNEGWTPLHMAICHRRTETVKLLLGLGASTDGGSGITALHTAAATGQVDLLEYLTSHGHQTDIEVRDLFTSTPLRYAFTNGHWTTAVPWLIRHGADINCTSTDNMGGDPRRGEVNGKRNGSMILLAAENARLQDVVALLRLGSDPTGILTRYGTQSGTISPVTVDTYSLLHLLVTAIPEFHMSKITVRELPRPIAFDWELLTYIHRLSKPGKEIQRRDPNPEWEIFQSRLIGLLAVVGVPNWLSRRNYNPPIVLSSELGRVADVKALLEAGVDPNERAAKSKAQSPYRTAVSRVLCLMQCHKPDDEVPLKNYLAIVQLLLTHGAKVQQHDLDLLREMMRIGDWARALESQAMDCLEPGEASNTGTPGRTQASRG